MNTLFALSLFFAQLVPPSVQSSTPMPGITIVVTCKHPGFRQPVCIVRHKHPGFRGEIPPVKSAG